MGDGERHPATAERDTIFALSSAPGRAGVAVVRCRDRDADAALEALTRRPLPAPRMAAVANHCSDFRTVLGSMSRWCCAFPAPQSFTGEECCRDQHAWRAGRRRGVLGALGRHAGPAAGRARRVHPPRGRERPARSDPGRGDRRSGRRRDRGPATQALAQMDGALASTYEDWRARLIRAAAWLEASIDFADEEIPAGAVTDSRRALADIAREIAAHLDDRPPRRDPARGLACRGDRAAERRQKLADQCVGAA